MGLTPPIATPCQNALVGYGNGGPAVEKYGVGGIKVCLSFSKTGSSLEKGAKNVPLSFSLSEGRENDEETEISLAVRKAVVGVDLALEGGMLQNVIRMTSAAVNN